ncbi:MAG: carboxypeptidase regulatory-like domain-containing protein [Deltaproteobacteria bacterium]|nr:carboxypeptidase regulatory-like domain-containing protein [Deltaproteobacteria bacterium]
MKTRNTSLLLAFALTASALLFMPYAHASGIDGGYVGTDACLACHDGSLASDKTGFTKTGHPWKYKHTGGMTPVDPLSGLFPRPLLSGLSTATLNGFKVDDGSGRLDWSAINYTIGGYGWKIRWGLKDPSDAKTGYVWTGSQAQYNLDNGSSSAYNSGTDKKNECATCHQTNGSVFTYGYSCYTDPLTANRSQPLLSNPGTDLEEITGDAIGNEDGVCDTAESCKIGGYRSQWTFDGVQCEACHGQGSGAGDGGHADVGGSVTQGVLTLAGGVEICAKCHIRGENTPSTGAECGGDANPAILANGAKITDPFIGHHEQYNEMHGLSNDGVHSSLTCTTCHDPHKRAANVLGSVATALGITGDNTKPEPGAIRVQCGDCHRAQADADAASAAANPTGKHADHASLSCVDCHMAEATKTATNASTAGWGRKGDLKTHIFDINPAGSSIVRNNGFTNVAQNYITPKYACGKCHDAGIYGSVIAGPTNEAAAQAEASGYHSVAGIDGGYVGSEACSGCHAEHYDEFTKSGHPYKVRMTDGATPTAETDPLSALLADTMPNTADLLNPNGETDVKVSDAFGKLDWSAVSYVIGGFGWKARWGVNDTVNDSATGYIWSSSVSSPSGAQFNMLAADPDLDPSGKRPDWSTYGSATKKYQCAACHNTNGTTSADAGCTTALGSGRDEPWASTGLVYTNPGGFRSEWSLSGVQCEACHGTGAAHVTDPSANVMAMDSSKDACGTCHIRAENTSGMGAECNGTANPAILTNGAKITGDYINHHEQYNELVGLSDGVHRSLDCVDCHDPHMRSHQVTDGIAAALDITDNDLSAEARGAVASCDSCHPGKTLKYPMSDVTCIDCHMAEATKSATSESPEGAWGRMGDVKTHIFKVDPAATTITRSNGFTNVAANALSVKYACGKCHDSSMGSYVGNGALTLAEAQAYAENIHDDAPTANFGYALGSPNTLVVNVDGSSSFCSKGACAYDWNWGDGSAHGSGVTASHTYASAGSKTITLAVKDTVALSSDSKSVNVTVVAPDAAPTAAGTCSFNANTWTETVTDTSTDDNGVKQVTVNWGDGSVLANDTTAPFGPFSHAFTKTGTFTITHKAIDTIGQQNSTTCTATPAYFSIGGTVKNKLGTANLASAVVTVKKSGVVVKTVYTSATGAFSAGSLKPGTYTLTVTKSGYTFASPAATLTIGPSSAGNVINATAP